MTYCVGEIRRVEVGYIFLVSIDPERQQIDILGGTGAPPPETIQFELYWECLDGDDGPMKTGVEAYAIFIHLFNKATTKTQKNEILDKHGFRKMTGFTGAS